MADHTPSRWHIRTSGCRVFRRCFRKWQFESSMKRNLTPRSEKNIHFWFGSGIHFALEDYFGHNRFGDPRRALKAYYEAFAPMNRPEGADEQFALGEGMLKYFMEWYPRGNEFHGFETVWVNEDGIEEVEPHTEGGRPLCEEEFTLDLGIQIWYDAVSGDIIHQGEQPHWIRYDEIAASFCYHDKQNEYHEVKTDSLKYHGTVDRVVKDKHGRWYIWDWKTAARPDTAKLETDDQVSRYLWAMEQHFQRPIEGFVYVQLTKEHPKPPKRLKNGELSTDKRQKTTAFLIKKELIKDYGSVGNAPQKFQDYYNVFLEQESQKGDRFVSMEVVERTREQKISTYEHVMSEARLMADPGGEWFPSPTKDCSWDCSFRDACIMMDKGQHEEAEDWLQANFKQRPRSEDGGEDDWYSRIKWPEGSLPPVEEEHVYLDAEGEVTLNLVWGDE